MQATQNPHGKLVCDGSTLIVPSSVATSLYQGIVCLISFMLMSGFFWVSHSSKDWTLMIISHGAAIVAPVMLICAIQSFVWALRRLPDLILTENGVTVFLCGFRAIHLAPEEIDALRIYKPANAGVALAIEPRDLTRFRKGLSLLDRFYFDQSRRFVGHGLSMSLRLDADEMSRLYARLRTQYGDRAEALVHVNVPAQI